MIQLLQLMVQCWVECVLDQCCVKVVVYFGQQFVDYIQWLVYVEIDMGLGDGGGNGYQQGVGLQVMLEQEGQGKGKVDGVMVVGEGVVCCVVQEVIVYVGDKWLIVWIEVVDCL